MSQVPHDHAASVAPLAGQLVPPEAPRLVGRRSFLSTASVVAAGAAASGASVAFAQAPAVVTSPSYELVLASSFPSTLSTIYGAAEHFAKRTLELSGGKVSIKVVAAGTQGISPSTKDAGAKRKGPDHLWAVEEGRAHFAHTASYYYADEDKSFGFGTSMPFGLNSRQLNAWMNQGGGLDLLNEFYGQYGLMMFPGGNTGTQMGGWWRDEIKTVSDLKDVKFRTGGVGGFVCEMLGAKRVTAIGGELYEKMKNKEIDAAEWIGPYDDERLKLYELAKNYYYPGWWEPGATINFFTRADIWAKFPVDLQSLLKSAMIEANARMQEQYDFLNPPAMASLLNKGVKFRRFSEEIMRAAYHASYDLYAMESAKNPAFRKIFASYDSYRKSSNAWFSVAEASMDSFIQRMR